MSGLFNNEGLYEHQEWLWNGDWYEDQDGYLYIVPTEDSTAECAGPDNKTMDSINAACRQYGKLRPADELRLGLTKVDDVLKRFHPRDGYYHA